MEEIVRLIALAAGVKLTSTEDIPCAEYAYGRGHPCNDWLSGFHPRFPEHVAVIACQYEQAVHQYCRMN
jgi:hypothetical protein